MNDSHYKYWDKRYKVGKIDFIKSTKDYPQRKFFADWVINNENIKSVLEIGPGEMLEYQMIRQEKPSVKYAISDVANIFIKNCKKKYPEVKTYNLPLEELDKIEERFDCVYQSCVFEHAVDVQKAIENSIKLGKEFHFVFFKWRWRKGKLRSRYYKNKGFHSTCFNIQKIIQEIEKHGTIDYTKVISKKNGKHFTMKQFLDMKIRTKGFRDKQRDGNWLAIHGRRNDENN